MCWGLLTKVQRARLASRNFPKNLRTIFLSGKSKAKLFVRLPHKTLRIFFLVSRHRHVISSVRSVRRPLLKLIDFGRAIDARSLPPSTVFMKNCGTSGFECCQMKEKQPWNYHVSVLNQTRSHGGGEVSPTFLCSPNFVVPRKTSRYIFLIKAKHIIKRNISPPKNVFRSPKP